MKLTVEQLPEYQRRRILMRKYHNYYEIDMQYITNKRFSVPQSNYPLCVPLF